MTRYLVDVRISNPCVSTGQSRPSTRAANDFKIADWLTRSKSRGQNEAGVLDSRGRILYVLDTSRICGNSAKIFTKKILII